jgi:hypothetical protein
MLCDSRADVQHPEVNQVFVNTPKSIVGLTGNSDAGFRSSVNENSDDAEGTV